MDGTDSSRTDISAELAAAGGQPAGQSLTAFSEVPDEPLMYPAHLAASPTANMPAVIDPEQVQDYIRLRPGHAASEPTQ